MKYLQLSSIIFTLFLFSCGQPKTAEEAAIKTDSTQAAKSTAVSNDKAKDEIKNLIRKMLSWAESKNGLELLPAVTDSKDSLYIGFDQKKLNKNLEILKASNLFSAKFIDNYNQIILTLDKKLKNNEFGKWPSGDLPSFSFNNDVDPWCLCQDVPYDSPIPWNLIEVEVISLDNEKGELKWNWGKPELNNDPSWKKFSYKFEAEKENGVWKIAYLEGFDFKKGTTGFKN